MTISIVRGACVTCCQQSTFLSRGTNSYSSCRITSLQEPCLGWWKLAQLATRCRQAHRSAASVWNSWLPLLREYLAALRMNCRLSRESLSMQRRRNPSLRHCALPSSTRLRCAQSVKKLRGSAISPTLYSSSRKRRASAACCMSESIEAIDASCATTLLSSRGRMPLRGEGRYTRSLSKTFHSSIETMPPSLVPVSRQRKVQARSKMSTTMAERRCTTLRYSIRLTTAKPAG
mmetsp:Transcript_8103/g.18133  ORF Transcript_8103/g.18133 Transcript_8103/m.18133 type:complete len:232 (-) Transcript_8103:2014-2709(-)